MDLNPSTPFAHEKSVFFCPGCYNSYNFMGAHPAWENGVFGWRFRVWAPHARAVSVVGSFNNWRPDSHYMQPEPGGLWSLFIPSLAQYDCYQYAVRTEKGSLLYKADPYAFHAETRPGTASKLYDLEGYQWGDIQWQARRTRRAEQGEAAPINLYEVHLGSWRRTGDGQVLNYRTMAEYLVPYVKEMGFTGVKLLPVGEHPLDESLGYQLTGYFAVTSRFGTPTDFMYLVDQLHQAGISVVLDYVSTGFPRDAFGLYLFDGVPCYGVSDPIPAVPEEKRSLFPLLRQRFQNRRFPRISLRPIPAENDPVQEVCEFDVSKPEVQNFLISAAFFWLDKFHVDGLHFTGTPVEAADFISHVNQTLHQSFPYVTTFAGEPQDLVGFDHCWYTDWTEQMLDRITDPSQVSSIFSSAERPSSSCVLPLCHDLVAPPHPSLASRMLGDDDMKFAQVRAFYLFFLTQPGSKLTMMGTEFGQWTSWNCLQSLDWHLLQYEFYQRQQRFFRDANDLYLSTPALWERDSDESFRVLKTGAQDSAVVYTHRGHDGCDYYIAVNFSPSTEWRHCWFPTPCAGVYEVIFSTDNPIYGGSGSAPQGAMPTHPDGGTGSCLSFYLPPMTAVLLRCVRAAPRLIQPLRRNRTSL